MAVRRRRFKDQASQKVYDHFRNEKPDPEKVRSKGSTGNAYAVGFTSPDNPRPFSQPGSAAYAAWAAGIDNARDSA